MSVALASSRTGMPSRVGGGRSRFLARAGGLDLAGDNVGIPTLNVDHSCVPMVTDGKLGTDLFVTACPRRNSPSQTWLTENPPCGRENVAGGSGTRDRALAGRGPGVCVTGLESRQGLEKDGLVGMK